MTDPISDMLTRMRNAQMVGHLNIEIPFSKNKFALAKILAKQGFLKNVDKLGKGNKRIITIELLYTDAKKTSPKITQIKRISKSGKREYVKSKDIRPVLGGRGISVISTSEGLMTDAEAKKKNLGGEVICEIW